MTIRQQPGDFFVRELLSKPFQRLIVPQPTRSENHVVLVLSKESLATPEAIRKLARTVGVRAERVSYAGLKDKHAQTIQHVSIGPEPTGSPARLHGVVPRVGARVGEAGWEAEVIGFAPDEVSASAIDGNSFELVVRDLSRQASDEMGRRADLLWTEEGVPQGSTGQGRREVEGDGPGDVTSVGSSDDQPGHDPASVAGGGLRVVNYFGAQRFGGARHGQGWIGRALLEGDFESALRLAIGTPARKDTGRVRVFTRLAVAHWGDWDHLARTLPLCPERRAIESLASSGDGPPDFKRAFVQLPYFTQQMAVEAYQSLLWNRSAARLAERLARECATDDGASIGPDAAGREARHLLRSPDQFGEMLFPTCSCVPTEWRGIDMPVLARKTELDPRWAWAVEATLAEEGLEQSRLKIPGLNKPFFGEAPRPLFVVARNFRMSGAQRDVEAGGRRVMRHVAFDLPRGAYATVVLRALGQ